MPWLALILAGTTAFLFIILFGPSIIRLLTKLKLGQTVRTDGPKTHQKKSGTPTMGGVLILFGITAGTLAGLGSHWSNNLRWTLFLTLGYGALGFLDDLLNIIYHRSLGLKARYKLLGQVFFAGLFGLYVVQSGVMETLKIPYFSTHLAFINPVLTFLFVVFTLVAMSNAVNLTDGLDGLAGGTTLIAGLAMGILALLQGETALATFAAAIVGACLGFVWFNAPPAQVFMGDTGALALGGALGAIGILSRTALFLPIIGGIFVAENLSVILQVLSFKATGKRILRMAPLHHHYELGGLSESKVVIRFWIVGILLALLGLAGYKIG
ncbi:MAG: phospho-N-acetylmuramoyl-pentapeptide-transferase [Firmicutes bacterium]|nr:phospho-N-acetylmuramoyl-pentapeptide-transferase [Bacillota bacterium]